MLIYCSLYVLMLGISGCLLINRSSFLNYSIYFKFYNVILVIDCVLMVLDILFALAHKFLVVAFSNLWKN